MSQDQKENQKEEIKEEQVKESEGEILKIQPPLNCKRDKHYFRRISGTSVECMKCPIGYNISLGTEVKNGHIYIHGQFII